jgi:hypothetical protein
MQQDDSTDQQLEKKNQKRMLCPFVRSPHTDCYFMDMNSNKISMAVYYCRNRFKQCGIYKKLTRPEKRKSY